MLNLAEFLMQINSDCSRYS